MVSKRALMGWVGLLTLLLSQLLWRFDATLPYIEIRVSPTQIVQMSILFMFGVGLIATSILVIPIVPVIKKSIWGQRLTKDERTMRIMALVFLIWIVIAVWIVRIIHPWFEVDPRWITPWIVLFVPVWFAGFFTTVYILASTKKV